jgi:hypothetical protein
VFDKKYLSEFSKLFNTSALIEFANSGRSHLLDYIINETKYLKNINSDITLLQIYDKIYTLLFDEFRCEYIYKNTIVNHVLIGKHSESNSTLFSEFQAGNSIADILILNGTSSIYEIKTELDNLERLNNQLDSYFQLFDKINVITFSSGLGKVNKIIDKKVGLLTLNKDGEIETQREPVSNLSNVVPAVIFDSLRMQEYKFAVLKNFGYIPNVPNTLIYRECKRLFEQLSPIEAHKVMVEVLKTRKQIFIKKLLLELPVSLKMTCLNSSLTKTQWRCFQQTLNTSYMN